LAQAYCITVWILLFPLIVTMPWLIIDKWKENKLCY
jgi:hypothetical protein